MPIVKFQPFSSLVSPTLWHELTRVKLDVLHLSDASVPLTGSYSTGKTIRDRNTGQDVALGCNLSVGGEGFEGEFGSSLGPGTVAASGTLKNYNTIEEFKNADKHALFNQAADEIWNSIITTRSTSLLTHFLVITFADLKKYKYYYWFAFPAFTAKPAWEVEGEWVGAGEERGLGDAQMSSIHAQLAGTTPTKAFFLVKPSKTKGEVEIASVEEWASFFEGVPDEDRTIGFIDPSPHPQNPGWPLRNLLAALRAWYPAATSGGLRVLCWRDGEVPHVGEDGKKEWKSRFGVVRAGPSESAVSETQKPGAVGWERNVQDKMGARMADLAPMMDPKRLADQAVDLNLKLMRWRILPELDLEKIAGTRCLLLGAGTLGCYVARTLMGWGIRTITLVDSGRVSFSNPVRQPLFEFEDCVDGGKPKAECAAGRLKKIFPGVNATGHTLSIPMPGHPIPPSAQSIAQCKSDVEKLEKLVDEHDAVFLLMDSRESRWLPTVLGSAKGKIVLNAALGFDTYLVMRHGARTPAPTPEKTSGGANTPERLGCYYCNDIVAPADSLTDRTLDQMCTVTRPGLASIAASTAVELLVSMIQHPAGIHAPPPPATSASSRSDTSNTINADANNGVLGQVPHQLRGFLAQSFRNMPIVGAAYGRCTGCSETVLKEYESKGFDMLLRAFNETGYLEELTGLADLHKEGEQALEAVDWDEEDGGEGDDF